MIQSSYSAGMIRILIVFLSLSFGLLAQTYGEIAGTVMDPSGAVLAAVEITIENPATGFVRKNVKRIF